MFVSQPFCALPSQSLVPAGHAVQAPAAQVWVFVQVAVVQVFPQLVSRLMVFSQALAGEPSQSRVPAEHVTHAPPVHVCVFGVHGTAVFQVPVDEHVWTASPEHCVVVGTQPPVQAPLTQA